MGTDDRLRSEQKRRGLPAGVDRWKDRLEAVVWGGERQGFAAASLRAVVISAWKFRSDLGFIRASALTYTTLLSIVPLFALAFSVLKGLGVQNRLEPLLLERIAVGNEELVSRIVEYIDRTDVRTLGVVGLLGLLVTVVGLLGNIERSFNEIWKIPEGRSYVRMLTDYVTLVVVSPVLLLASLSVTTTLSSKGFLGTLGLLGPVLVALLKLLPFAASWVALTLVYTIMPNRLVPLRPSLVGGVAAGTLWQLAQWGYVRFQFGMAKYNAIYGAMAQLPVLLVWIYASWCIVLFGAELACVVELPGQGRSLRKAVSGWVPRLDAALPILLAVAQRFEESLPAPEEKEVLSVAGFPEEEGGRIVDHLVGIGLLVRTRDEPPRLLPARSPDRTPAGDLFARLNELSSASGEKGAAFNERIRQGLAREFSDLTWADLAAGRRD